MDDITKRNIETLAQRFRGNGKQVVPPGTTNLTQFARLRETVIGPAVEDVLKQLGRMRKTEARGQLLQARAGGAPRDALRWTVAVWTEDTSSIARCEIEFAATLGEDLIRVRGARPTFVYGATKEASLSSSAVTSEKVQQVFSDFLNALLVLDS